jgi:hypothetical protein
VLTPISRNRPARFDKAAWTRKKCRERRQRFDVGEARMSEWLQTTIDALSTRVLPLFDTYWPSVEKFFDSGFFTAIVGSFAAAYAGARAAQLIAEKTRNREELLREIRATNATTMVAFGITNTLLSVKKQHIKPLKEQFDQQRAATREALAKQQQGQAGVIEFHANYLAFPALTLPLSILQTQIFEKLSLHGRPIALATTLTQSMDGLNVAIAKRNELIESYKTWWRASTGKPMTEFFSASSSARS